jgi:hypothetical protein
MQIDPVIQVFIDNALKDPAIHGPLLPLSEIVVVMDEWLVGYDLYVLVGILETHPVDMRMKKEGVRGVPRPRTTLYTLPNGGEG